MRFSFRRLLCILLVATLVSVATFGASGFVLTQEVSAADWDYRYDNGDDCWTGGGCKINMNISGWATVYATATYERCTYWPSYSCSYWTETVNVTNYWGTLANMEASFPAYGGWNIISIAGETEVPEADDFYFTNDPWCC